MKNFRIIIMVFVGIYFLSSCLENPEYVLYSEPNGTAEFLIVDLDGNPVENAECVLSTIIYSSDGSENNSREMYVDQYTTKSDGIYSTNLRTVGDYRLGVFADKNKLSYSVRHRFELSDKTNETVTLSPFEEAGDIVITITNENKVAISDLNIGLLSHTNYLKTTPLQYLKSEAVFQTKTDKSGRAYINDIPGSKYFKIFAYNDSDDYQVLDYFYSRTDSTIKITYPVNF